VYALPGMDLVRVTSDIPYKTGAAGPLRLDVYAPHAAATGADRVSHHAGGGYPTVVFVSGGGAHKDGRDFVSYGRLAAAAGVAAVTFDTHPAGTWEEEHLLAADVDDLLAYVRVHAGDLQIDPDRLALWVFSAGTTFGLRSVMRDTPAWVRCLVVFYGALDAVASGEHQAVDINEFSPLRYLRGNPLEIAPMFVARAGRDRPALNATIDRYVAAALELNADLRLVNHPGGPHAFATRDDSPRSREIVRAALEFVRTHLGLAGG
jgi:acetyl esterase/lipase